MGTIYVCGSDEQRDRWLPRMARLEQIGAFGLTEPDVGSGASRSLTTTARRDGDHWILNGQKKWIGNASFASSSPAGLAPVWGRPVMSATAPKAVTVQVPDRCDAASSRARRRRGRCRTQYSASRNISRGTAQRVAGGQQHPHRRDHAVQTRRIPRPSWHRVRISPQATTARHGRGCCNKTRAAMSSPAAAATASASAISSARSGGVDWSSN
jgi:hypothetical protein